MPQPLLEQIIEEAALIWLRERDGMPCSIRRSRLDLMLCEYIHEMINLSPLFQAAETPPPLPALPRLPDFKKRAANDREEPLVFA